jgi:hypothetical protein
MPWLATSLASASASPMTPALAVEEGTGVGLPSLPAMEAMASRRLAAARRLRSSRA